MEKCCRKRKNCDNRRFAFCRLFLLGMLLFCLTGCGKKEEIRFPDLEAQAEAGHSYEGLFASMVEVPNYPREPFLVNRGLDVWMEETTLVSSKYIEAFLTQALEHQSELTEIYLVLDPQMLYKEAAEKNESFQKLLEKNLLNVVTANPNITFEITLPWYSAGYWTTQTESTIGELKESYVSFVEQMEAYSNVKVFLYGDEEWLWNNEDNYLEGSMLELQPALYEKMFLYTVCDGCFRITASEIGDRVSVWQEKLLTLKKDGEEKYNLPGKSVVVFGDSIFGNFTGTTSIQGVLREKTGAFVYCCAVGGMRASDGPNNCDFPNMLENILGEESRRSILPEWYDAYADYENVREVLASSGEGENLIFVIEYGINDFLEHAPYFAEGEYTNETTEGALRKGIERLQKQFPKAEIVLIAPGYLAIGDSSENLSVALLESLETDEVWYLSEVRNLIVSIGNELGFPVFRVAEDTELTQENTGYYLNDGIHPNERGRYEIGVKLGAFLSRLH